MAKKVEDVVKDVLALSGAERRELVRLLQSQLDAGLEATDAEQVWIQEKLRNMLGRVTSSGYASPEIERAWREEIQRRERDIAEGRGEWLPGEEVIEELRKRYCG